MKKLLYKEFKLCMHPMVMLFYLFALMLLIPNYLYLVPCFFTCNSLFYAFQQGAASNDTLFTVLLPISKRKAVLSKLLFVVMVQIVMAALYVPMIFLNHAVFAGGNKAGIDACFTLIAAAFILFSIFNLVFLPSFFKTGYKAGRSFLLASIAVFVWIFLCDGLFIASNSESLCSAVPFFKWVADTLDCWPAGPRELGIQLALVGAGALIYGVSNLISYRLSVKRFEMVDL